MQEGHVDRPLCRQRLKLIRREAAVPRDLGEHLFRGLARKLADGRAHHGAERQNRFVDRDQIDNIARLAAVGCRSRLVGRQIDRMEHIAEQLVRLSGKNRNAASVAHSSCIVSPRRATVASRLPVRTLSQAIV